MRPTSERLRELADKLQPDIDANLNPSIARLPQTRRRAAIAERMRQVGHRLELVQRAMRRMAVWHECPETVQASAPECVARAGLVTRKAFEALREDELTRIAGGPRVETPADRIAKLEAQLIGATIPGFFPTPAPVIRTMLTYARIHHGHRVLEPSAGKGDIAAAVLARASVTLECVERHHTLRGILDAKGLTVLSETDFLAYRPTYSYDRIVMNPPFEKLADIAHVRHAYDLLAPGGRLVAIVGEGAFQRRDARAEDFRAWIGAATQEDRCEVIQVPEGSFTGPASFRQTGVNCRIVVLDKPAAVQTTAVEACDQRTSHSPAPPTRPHATSPPGPPAAHERQVGRFLVERPDLAADERDAERRNHPGRAGVDWRAAGLKAWATRRANAAARLASPPVMQAAAS